MNATMEKPHVAGEHHQRLVHHVDRIPAVADSIDDHDEVELRRGVDETCDFLTELLLPHMEAAERAFYPELERLFQNRHSMTPMRREHELIRGAVEELLVIRQRLDTHKLGTGESIRLRRALFRVYSLLKVHLAEELLYAAIIEKKASPADEEALATAMQHAGTSAF
jgi:hypothetical protein